MANPFTKTLQRAHVCRISFATEAIGWGGISSMLLELGRLTGQDFAITHHARGVIFPKRTKK
jgi:hypothetical protein